MALLARTRDQWPVFGYILPSRDFLIGLTWLSTFAGFAVVALASYGIRFLPTGKNLADYALLAGITSVASGFRRGQVFYERERRRALDLAFIANSNPVQLYSVATIDTSRQTVRFMALAVPGLQLAFHYQSGESWATTLAATVLIELVVGLFYVRTMIGHLAVYFERVQPPQVLYLIAGFAVAVTFGGSLLSAPTFADPPLVELFSASGPFVAAALIVLSLVVVLFVRSDQSIRHLVLEGPLVQAGLSRRQLRYPTWLPLSLWTMRGRSSGSVVFAFSLTATYIAIALNHYRDAIYRIKPPYGGPELFVAVEFSIAISLGFVFCAPLGLNKLGVMGHLFRLARVNIERERMKLVFAACLPTFASTAILDGLLAGNLRDLLPGHAVLSGAIWASAWLGTTAAALSLIVAPALGRPMDAGRLPDDDVPLSEMMRTTLPCVLVSTLAVGYSTTPQANILTSSLLSAGAAFVACVSVGRLGVLAWRYR